MTEPADDLSALEAQMAELQAKITAAKEEKRKKEMEAAIAKAEAEKNQPVVVTFTRVVNNYVYLKNEPSRQDILEVLRDTEGRVWKGMERENGVPVGSYDKLVAALSALPNITIEYISGVQNEINEILYAPDFKCDLEERFFAIKASRKAYSYPLRQLPGHNFDWQRDIHTIPLSEGWRLYELAQNTGSGFVWTDKAKEFVLKQVENRLLLDKIAKEEDIPDLVIPEIKATLKGYQKVGIKFFELNGGRGILGDEMGTGKTLQMISLIVHNKWKAIVVCPATLKENWLREVRKFAPHLTTFTCQGESPMAYDIAKIIKETPDIIFINYDILATNVWIEDKTVVEKGKTRWPWAEVLNILHRDIVILDEAHYVKNTDSARSRAARILEAPRFISMTGTPVLNRPGELWPLLHLADPVTFPAYETFKRQYTYDGKTVRNLEELKSLLKPLMIRRLKRDVIKQLPPINRINSYFELSERGRKLYDRVLAGVFEILSDWSPNNAGAQKEVTNLLVQIQRLKQVVAIDGIEGTADLATSIYDASPEDGPPNKVLIFSQFKATTYAISKRLGQEALSFVSLSPTKVFVTAHYSEQQKLIDQFQSDKSINFLCVTEKTAKEGHNITAAQAVIFNDLFWTPAGHQQAEGRAYGRVSDLHTIDSYYRIGVNSISEKIMELLAAKLSLIEQVVEGVEASRADASIVHELLSSLKEEMWTIKKKK